MGGRSITTAGRRRARNATVLGVELEGDRAVGVRLGRTRGGGEHVRAEREVVLCAGTIGSAQLLLLSGIGPADELRQVGVSVRHDLPGVGHNLQDHPFVTILWEVNDQRTLYGADKLGPLAEWLLRRSGPLTSTVAEVVAFVRTRGGLPAADIQFHMGAAYFDDHGAEEYDGHCIAIGPVLVSPQARGQIWLGSSDPADKPRIITNSLAPADDGASLIAGMRLAREIASQSPLKELILKELKPGPQAVDDEEPRRRPAPPPDADLPPGGHLPHERHRRGRGRRLPAARPRHRGPAGG